MSDHHDPRLYYSYNAAEKLPPPLPRPLPQPSAPPLPLNDDGVDDATRAYARCHPPPPSLPPPFARAVDYRPRTYDQPTPLEPMTAAAVPIAQPVYPHLRPAAYPEAGSYRGRLRRPRQEHSLVWGFILGTARLALFHSLNALLGYVAFGVCAIGIVAAIALLPLCCFGIVVFRLVLHTVYVFAQLDVLLFNFISPPEQHVYVRLPQDPQSGGLAGERLAPSLSSFSPLSLMALIYFLTVKLLLAGLSSLSFWLAITAPSSILGAVCGFSDSAFYRSTFGPEDIADVDEDPVLFVVASGCVFVLGVGLMRLVARISRESTRFFCCERFSTYRYVHQFYDPQIHYFPTTGATTTATTSYGTIVHSTNPQDGHYPSRV